MVRSEEAEPLSHWECVCVCVCAKFGFLATGLQSDAPIITALEGKQECLEKKKPLVFVCVCS